MKASCIWLVISILNSTHFIIETNLKRLKKPCYSPEMIHLQEILSEIKNNVKSSNNAVLKF